MQKNIETNFLLLHHQCSSQEFQFWGPGAPTLQKVGDI